MNRYTNTFGKEYALIHEGNVCEGLRNSVLQDVVKSFNVLVM